MNATKDQVYNVMWGLDPKRRVNRGGVSARMSRKGNFTTRGSSWVYAMGCHDKVMGY